jgi:hypothetical protein
VRAICAFAASSASTLLAPRRQKKHAAAPLHGSRLHAAAHPPLLLAHLGVALRVGQQVEQELARLDRPAALARGAALVLGLRRAADAAGEAVERHAALAVEHVAQVALGLAELHLAQGERGLARVLEVNTQVAARGLLFSRAGENGERRPSKNDEFLCFAPAPFCKLCETPFLSIKSFSHSVLSCYEEDEQQQQIAASSLWCAASPLRAQAKGCPAPFWPHHIQ